MEVLLKLGIDWKLLLAQIVNFLVLLFVLRKFAYRPMLDFLEHRSKKIEVGLRDAKKASEKLTELEAKEKEVLSNARREAAELLRAAKESAAKTGDLLVAESHREAERILDEARRKIEAEGERFRSDMKGELTDLVLRATEKVLGEKMASEKDEALVREAVRRAEGREESAEGAQRS